MTSHPACGPCPYSLGNDTARLKDTWWQFWNVSEDLKDVQDEEVVLQEVMGRINNTLQSLGGSDGHLVSVNSSLRTISSHRMEFSDQVDTIRSQVDTSHLVSCHLSAQSTAFQVDTTKLC